MENYLREFRIVYGSVLCTVLRTRVLNEFCLLRQSGYGWFKKKTTAEQHKTLCVTLGFARSPFLYNFKAI